MDSSHDDSSSDERGTSVNTHNQDKKGYHRHSNLQIQRLEEFFKECPHPDDLQRRQLGEQLNLKPKQIKFWFQNKRTQAKTQNEKADNAALRAENLRIRQENEALEEALRTVVCPPCGGPRGGAEEREFAVHKLRLENAALKQKYERFSSYLTQHGAHTIPSVDALSYRPRPITYASTSNNHPASYGTSSNHILESPSSLRRPYTRENTNVTPPPKPRNPLSLQHLQPLSQLEKMVMIDTAEKAVAEVMSLIQIDEPIWVKSSIDGRLFIDSDNYEKFFTKVSHLKSTGARPESSKEVVVVQMDARNLVDMFLDTEKWARLFPTIVNEAKTIHVLEPVDNRSHNFSRVMYEQLHILSPLVPPREFMIIRSCQQIEEGSWMIADVSCDLPNVDFEFMAPPCIKRPSGVLIQALSHGSSKVTWVEHVEANDKMRTHRLYKDLICYGGFGYGARRWTLTLERMCERLSLSSVPDLPTTDYAGVVKTIEGRRSIMDLAERMSKNFSWILKMSEKLDFSQLSETNNSGVRVSVRINKRQAGQPPGLIVCAGSSLCLPLPPLQVYNFLTNIENRHQWDVLCHGNPVIEAAHFQTGKDLKNRVMFLKPSGGADDIEVNQLMILQDCFIDALGGMVVYAPVDLHAAYAAVSGTSNPSGIPILPSGFVISRDARSSAATELDGGRDNGTTLLTVAFQILVAGPTYYKEHNLEESTATVNTLISSTVQRIKAMLNCE